jgi:hypothetical protein
VEFMQVLRKFLDQPEIERYWRKKDIQAYFTRIFKEAYQIARRRVRRPDWSLDVRTEDDLLRGLKEDHRGFRDMRQRLFNEWFRISLMSRCRWYAEPTAPFSMAEHPPMAREIDKFLVACRERERFYWARWPPEDLPMWEESEDEQILDDERRSESPPGRWIGPEPSSDEDEVADRKQRERKEQRKQTKREEETEKMQKEEGIEEMLDEIQGELEAMDLDDPVEEPADAEMGGM